MSQLRTKDGNPRDDVRLTPACLEVLTLVFKGYVHSEIAAIRHTSEKTVGHQMASVLSTLDARNAAEAIYEAQARNLLQPPKRYVD